MTQMTQVSNTVVNKVGVAILPPQPYEMTPPKPGEPSALQRLAALAAAAVAHDRAINDSDSDSESDSDYCDSNTATDDSDVSDFVAFSLPFRIRRSSLPAALEGQKLAEVAKFAVRKIWSRRLANRSICN